MLLSVAVGVLAAGAYSWIQTPRYVASTQIFVSASAAKIDASDLNQGGSFIQQRVRSYVRIVDSPAVGEHVIDSLGLPYTPAQFAQRVDADSSADTVLIDITVSDESPSQARDIAAAIADYFPKLVDKLETSPGQKVSPVKVSVTKPATVPDGPASPRTMFNVLLGLLIGAGVGLGAAATRELTDRTVRTEEAVSAATSAPVLSTVPLATSYGGAPVISEGRAQSPRDEAMRRLRTNLMFVNAGSPLRSLVVTSALSGEGKSTTACNLGIAFAEAGCRVLLVDADLRRPQLAEYLNLGGAVGLTDVLTGQVAVADALQPWGGNGLWVLTSGAVPPNPSELLGSPNMAKLLASLTKGFDIVIIDSPPLLPMTDAAVIANIADGSLLVTRHARTTTAQASTAAAALATAGARLRGCVFNMVPRNGSSSYYHESHRPARDNQPARDSQSVPAPALSTLR